LFNCKLFTYLQNRCGNFVETEMGSLKTIHNDWARIVLKMTVKLMVYGNLKFCGWNSVTENPPVIRYQISYSYENPQQTRNHRVVHIYQYEIWNMTRFFIKTDELLTYFFKPKWHRRRNSSGEAMEFEIITS